MWPFGFLPLPEAVNGGDFSLTKESVTAPEPRPATVADTSEDANALRQQLSDQNLIAFVAEDSILPRQSGVDNRPLKGDGVIRFQTPDSLRVLSALRRMIPTLP